MARQSVKDKIIVITGASSGFGKGAALELARLGARLVLAARRKELLEALARQCIAQGAKATAVAADVSKREDVERIMQAALQGYGGVDVWINDAGVGALGPFERIPLEDHEQVIRTNLFGTLYGSWCAYRQFLAQGHGILINIASELGTQTVPYYSSYAAAKHGVVGLSDSLRQEIGQKGIEGVHVCTIMPSAHDTPFFDHAANYTGREIQAPRPLHDPQDVVDAIVRIAQDPQDKEIVGADGVVKLLLKKLAAPLQEKAAARQMHEAQMEKPPPAADSPGALRKPMAKGTEVRAGRA